MPKGANLFKLSLLTAAVCLTACGDLDTHRNEDAVASPIPAPAPTPEPTPAPTPDESLMTVYVKVPDSWSQANIHYWDAAPQASTDWPGLPMSAMDDNWYSYQFAADVEQASIVFNNGSGDQSSDVTRSGTGCFWLESESWTDECDVGGEAPIFVTDIAAHWVSATEVLWDVAGDDIASYELRYDPAAGITITDGMLSGGTAVELSATNDTISDEMAEVMPHHAERMRFAMESLEIDDAKAALSGQVVVAALDADGKVITATRVQTPWVIDEYFAYDGDLGVTYTGDTPTLRVWAPTAQALTLKLYNADMTMAEEVTASSTTDKGVWEFEGDSDWTGMYYQYAVTAYHPISNMVESYDVTDPYAVSLAVNSAYSQIIDLNDNDLKPAGWDAIQKDLPEAEDIVLYETHIRDFSVSDMTVTAANRGKYAAFTENGVDGAPLSDGMAHLVGLQQAGLSHIHLLPTFDIASVNEDPTETVDLMNTRGDLCAKTTALSDFCSGDAGETLQAAFSGMDPTTGDVQAVYAELRSLDSFNWGYDPYHFNVPEGSYATDASGTTRIVEFRDMVKSLDEVGLNVVMDVVYNHTSASGLNQQSVLDKLVPGYFHRRNVITGAVENSSCCENTASEHKMMEKLLIDSVVVWAKEYKVDSFRFDLMGHHMLSNITNLQAALAELTLAEDGVDGKDIYLYGEGWNFGEVESGARGENAIQINMAGTGVGTFNDRIRDAVRGGGPFDSGDALIANQGFINGLYYDPNDKATADDDTKSELLYLADRIRVSLAGNLMDYPFENRNGTTVSGQQMSGTGYTADPQENIVYISKHDNQTLFDNNMYKVPADADMAARVRVQNMGMSINMLAQGIPFMHMGVDLLRSKSLDRNSYDSGDWFNVVDFSKQSNNWNVGLPLAGDNSDNWETMGTIISNTNIAPMAADIAMADAHFKELLMIRKDSELFRLRDEASVSTRLKFHNTGADQIPGLIAMSISDAQCAGDDLDADSNGMMVIFNATTETQTVNWDGVTDFELHPVLAAGEDAVVKTASFADGDFMVPARTTAVFHQPQSGAQGANVPCNDKMIAEAGIKVFFKAPAEWETASIYFWNAAPADGPDWPGNAMTSLGDGWYEYQFPDQVVAADIVFNDNGMGNQTADQYREGDGCFEADISTWSDSCELPGMTVYSKIPDSWTSNYIYYWEAAPVATDSVDWPGVEMEDLGEGWYKFQFPYGVRESKIIFNNNGSPQTENLIRDSNGCFDVELNQWADTCDLPE